MRFVFLALLLVGCSTAPKPTPIPIEPQTKEKDQYITKVESVVSDSASALTAVVPVLDKGTIREVVEAQVTRLSGIAKPSVAKVEEFTRIIKQNDTKAVEQDKKEASKVDEETTALYAMVEQKDFEIAEAHARADGEFKQKVLWQFSTAGLGLFIVGVLVTAFTPLKKSGAIVMGGGSLAMASLWLFDSKWFTYIAATSVGIVVFSLLIMLAKNLFPKRPIDNESDSGKLPTDLV